MIRKIGKREIELNEVDENTTEFLEVQVTHSDNVYFVNVTKLEKSNKFGYNTISYVLFADGNFRFRIKEGRFSKKQAENLCVNLAKLDMATVKMLWLAKKYEILLGFIKDTLLLENK